MLGNARPATDPARVRIYKTPPPKYEEIALVGADNGGGPPFSANMGYQVAMGRLKENAAAVGANGVILDPIDDNGPFQLRKVSGTAIHVP